MVLKKRPVGKLPTTAVTNEFVDWANANQPPIFGGQVPSVTFPGYPPQRFKVKQLPTATGSGTSAVLPPWAKCNTYNGTNTGSTLIDVRLIEPHGVGDILYAIAFAGGTDQTDSQGTGSGGSGSSSVPILWQEVHAVNRVWNVTLTRDDGGTTDIPSPTYTCNVAGTSGNVAVAQMKSPIRGRIGVDVAAGSQGFGIFDSTGGFQLIYANESIDSTACTSSTS